MRHARTCLKPVAVAQTAFHDCLRISFRLARHPVNRLILQNPIVVADVVSQEMRSRIMSRVRLKDMCSEIAVYRML